MQVRMRAQNRVTVIEGGGKKTAKYRKKKQKNQTQYLRKEHQHVLSLYLCTSIPSVNI